MFNSKIALMHFEVFVMKGKFTSFTGSCKQLFFRNSATLEYSIIRAKSSCRLIFKGKMQQNQILFDF